MGEIIMDQIIVPALKENLPDVLGFIEKILEPFQYDEKSLLRLELAVEEAYANIVNYAYDSENNESQTNDNDFLSKDNDFQSEDNHSQSKDDAPQSNDDDSQSDDNEIIINCSVDETPLKITVQLIDSGRPFNPLENEDPNISLKIEDKPEGGLGIFLIKNNVDNLQYEYVNGKNILTLHKLMK